MFKELIKYFLSKEMAFYNEKACNYFERNINNDIKVFQKLYPKDDISRSIAQHKCQVYPFKKDMLKLNIMSFIMTPAVMVSMLLKRRAIIEDNQSAFVCYKGFNFPGSLPEALRDRDIRYLKGEECPYYLSKEDISFLLRFYFRSLCHPFLAFRVLMKVSRYRAIVDSFPNLETIAVTGEFEDTSSAMTQYCREKGIKHYNFMQGDMFGSYRTAFFHFDKCFVWDQYYIDQFVTFGAVPEQFVISLPQCLQKIEGNHSEKKIDCIYYIGGYPDEDLTTIRTAIDKLVAKGYTCEIRPHPRWSNMEEIRSVFKGLIIQDTSTISVDKSLLMTKNAIGLCSTVLLQAYYNDVNVVIDDLSSSTKYEMLEGYQYIMLNKPHKLLSEITES